MDFSKIPFDLVINILNIVVIFPIVRLLAYKPIRKFLDARRQKLDDEKTANEKIKAEAEEKKAEYEALKIPKTPQTKRKTKFWSTHKTVPTK